jgi:hypothetical protein
VQVGGVTGAAPCRVLQREGGGGVCSLERSPAPGSWVLSSLDCRQRPGLNARSSHDSEFARFLNGAGVFVPEPIGFSLNE